MNKYDNRSQVSRSIRKIAESHRPDIFAFKTASKDNRKWQQIFLAGIVGPPETPYEGGIFYISVSLLNTFYNYKFQFLTKIIHPNINEDGKILVEMPDEVKKDIEDGLIWIIELLRQPKWKLAEIKGMLRFYEENQEKYNVYVKEAVIKYAI